MLTVLDTAAWLAVGALLGRALVATADLAIHHLKGHRRAA
jgi:hypothetical protein